MAEENQEGVENKSTPSAEEVEAKQFGWVPQEDFKGNPDEWRDAETFLRRGKEINGFLRKDLDKIMRLNQSQAAELAEVRATMEEFKKFHNETEQRAYKRAFDALKAEKVEAISTRTID